MKKNIKFYREWKINKIILKRKHPLDDANVTLPLLKAKSKTKSEKINTDNQNRNRNRKKYLLFPALRQKYSYNLPISLKLIIGNRYTFIIGRQVVKHIF